MNTTDKTETPPAPKCCARCRQVLPLSRFGKDPHQQDGFNSRCKSCRRAEAKRWRVEHPDKAACKSAREVCIRHYGRAALTPEMIAAKVAELAGELAAKAERRVTRKIPVFATPPGTLTRHSLCQACGISLTFLRKHRLLNTAGIGDAAFRWQRDFESTLVLFAEEAAAPFVAAMRARRTEAGPRSPSSDPPAGDTAAA